MVVRSVLLRGLGTVVEEDEGHQGGKGRGGRVETEVVSEGYCMVVLRLKPCHVPTW